MTLVSIQLPEPLQVLIDSRLDTIDRMLLGRLPRQDRLAIVKEVESQIYEQLHEREAEELGRDDVLAVLARLDPPEAYLPEEIGSRPDSARVPLPAPALRTARREEPRLARASGILGLSGLGLTFFVLPLAFLVASAFESELLMLVGLFGTIVSIFAVGVLGLILGGQARKGGAWAIAGMVTGLISILLSTVAGIVLLIDLAS
jgi:hypothetical protein